MTLRLTDAETWALRDRARAEGRSMQDVARAAVREYIEARQRRDRIDEILDSELVRYSDPIERLGR